MITLEGMRSPPIAGRGLAERTGDHGQAVGWTAKDIQHDRADGIEESRVEWAIPSGNHGVAPGVDVDVEEEANIAPGRWDGQFVARAHFAGGVGGSSGGA